VCLTFCSLSGVVNAQSVTFLAGDVFAIPVVNGSIQFSVNGSYASAILENDTWIFSNLTLSESRSSGSLTFSAKNCDVTIHSFTPNRSASNSSFNSCRINYSVDGVGEQAINLGIDKSKPTHHSEWAVYNQNSTFFGEGKVWKLLPDNTVIVTGLSGTLTVIRYGYSYPVDERAFYLRHSVSILIGIIVAFTFAFATIIKLTADRNKPKELLV
jgi:hypothetical protein